MNIDLRTINLLRMKTLTVAILLAYLAGQLTHSAYTLDGAVAVISGVGAVVVGVLTVVNAFETLTWHRQYHRVQDHLRRTTERN